MYIVARNNTLEIIISVAQSANNNRMSKSRFSGRRILSGVKFCVMLPQCNYGYEESKNDRSTVRDGNLITCGEPRCILETFWMQFRMIAMKLSSRCRDFISNCWIYVWLNCRIRRLGLIYSRWEIFFEEVLENLLDSIKA